VTAAGPFRITITRDEINALPIARYDGPIRMVETEEGVRDALLALRGERVLGFDTETRPSRRKGESYPPALIQLAGTEAVYIFRLAALQGLGGLAPILADPRVLKVGVSPGRDVQELQAEEHFEPGGFVELEKLTDQLGIVPNGLRGLAAAILDVRITKGAKQTNWAVQQLRPAQITYAATDAWACRAIYMKLRPHLAAAEWGEREQEETTPVAAKTKPNILWISFEDTNPFYGCYGDTVARTPNLDRLAAQGARWPRCFSTAGVCAPARSAVITGMYPTSIGTHHMRTAHTEPVAPELPTPYSAVVPHYVKCFTEYLRAEGYYCCNTMKTDYQFDPPLTMWDHLSDEAHWRNRPDPEQPFFAVFNPTRTHESGMWADESAEVTFDPNEIQLPPYFPDTPKVRRAMARMYTNIERSDRELGELLQQLEDDGLADDTYVFHWSDHGPMPRGKRWPYDSGIHIPLIARGPGIEPGTVPEDLVSTIDLGPTMLSLAGIEVPPHMQGRAFLGDQAQPPREYVYATRDRYDISYDMVRAVRDKRFKYIRNCRPDLPYLLWIPYRNRHPIMQEMWRLHLSGELNEEQSVMFRPRPVEELYDTDADPYEINNLAGDPAHREDLERLSTELDRWRDEVGDLGNISESEMVRGWYPDGVQPQTAAPVPVAICEESPGMEPSVEGGTFRGPALVQLYCATQGASVACTFEEGESPRWQLYTTPLPLPPGTSTLRARAIRIGYRESEEARATFTVTA
jgi:N-sulfoglucosamine sulfohydrolase